MRDIKFRAWHKEYKTMIPWKLFTDLFEGMAIGITDAMKKRVYYDGTTIENMSPLANYKKYRSINIFNHSDFEIMQYTGLKDSKGKEIYEGDILKVTGTKRTFEGFGNDTGREYWSDPYPVERTYEVKDIRWFDAWNLVDEGEDAELQIIGNIHENPELLEEKA